MCERTFADLRLGVRAQVVRQCGGAIVIFAGTRVRRAPRLVRQGGAHPQNRRHRGGEDDGRVQGEKIEGQDKTSRVKGAKRRLDASYHMAGADRLTR